MCVYLKVWFCLKLFTSIKTKIQQVLLFEQKIFKVFVICLVVLECVPELKIKSLY